MHRHALIIGEFENVARVATQAEFPAYEERSVSYRNNGQVAQ